jgi:hypothetical protein
MQYSLLISIFSFSQENILEEIVKKVKDRKNGTGEKILAGECMRKVSHFKEMRISSH